MTDTIYFAQEPLWDKNGSRTHEHWVEIDQKGKMYDYYYGDERGTISMKTSDDLSELMVEAFAQRTYYEMEVKTNLLVKDNDKEIVQFT